jgi:hypothetical protein
MFLSHNRKILSGKNAIFIKRQVNLSLIVVVIVAAVDVVVVAFVVVPQAGDFPLYFTFAY